MRKNSQAVGQLRERCLLTNVDTVRLGDVLIRDGRCRMRRVSVVWILLALLAILALVASPAGSLAVKGGGVQIACGGSSTGCV